METKREGEGGGAGTSHLGRVGTETKREGEGGHGGQVGIEVRGRGSGTGEGVHGQVGIKVRGKGSGTGERGPWTGGARGEENWG